MKKNILTVLLVGLVFFMFSTVAFAAASEDSVEVVAAPVIGYDGVEFTLQLSVTDETATAGYGYGYELSNDPRFVGGEEVWRMTAADWTSDGSHHEPHDNDLITYPWSSGFLVPNGTYYVRGLLYDNRENMNIILTGNNVFSFTMPNEVSAYEPIDFGDTITAGTSGYLSYWQFTPDTSGCYGITTDSNITAVQIHDSTGREAGHVHQNDLSNPTDLALVFFTDAGETYYIYTESAWVDDSIQPGTFTLTDGKSVVPALTEGSPLEINNGAVVQFTAPDDGYYVISFADGDYECSLQYLDSNRNWKFANMQSYSKIFSKDETLFVRGNYYFYDGVAPKHLQVEKKTAANENSIEVSAATNVTNCSMDVIFTVSTTMETALHGFSPAIEYGPDPNLQQGLSRRFTNRYLDPMDHENVPANLGQFMPGQEFYYRAILIDSMTNQVVATGSDVYHVQFLNNLNGFTLLSLNVPFNLADTREGKFYFNPSADGMYSIQVDGAVNSVNVQQTNGMIFGVGGQLPSVLLGFYVHAGENAFLTVTNMICTDCDLTISDSSFLPTAGLGTTALSSGTPIAFTAPATGDYAFSVDNMQSPLQYLDENGNWILAGSEFSRRMQQGEKLWLFESFNPQMGMNLTVETAGDASMQLPNDLKEIEAEAFVGLPVTELILGSGLERIGSRAFADCSVLGEVIFGSASVDIAIDAFDGCPNVEFSGIAGGSVEQYALDHGIPFHTNTI